ncbi:MAG: cytidylate kinase-like family protein [Lachnospiraceae bacterium]|nr:cytidylate kinase-like family protein [Lachnospiraceae bacterium]
MKHMVITIGCEYGTGGPQIGRFIADALGIEFYDRDIVDKVVEETGVSRDLVEKTDVDANVKFEVDTSLGPRYLNLTNRVIYVQFDVIRQMAEKSSCVIIGRCADYILKERKDTLKVFLYAPRETRIRSVMELEHLSRDQAEKRVAYYDENEHVRYKYMTGTYRGDRNNRDILLNSALLGWEKTAKYLLQLIDLRYGE